MSMHIKFMGEYNSTTSYYGIVDKKYNFTAEVIYFSGQKSYIINSIKWTEEPKNKDKAESRIINVLMNWHKNKFVLSNFIEEDKVDIINKIIKYNEAIEYLKISLKKGEKNESNEKDD